MKQKLQILGVLIMFNISFLNGQEIKIHRFQGGYKYTQNKNVLKLKNLAFAVNANEEASNLAVSAKAYADLSFGIAFIGGAFVGAPIGKAMAGGDPKWISAGIGGGLILMGLQGYKISGDKAKAAIDIHNNNLSYQPSYSPEIHLTVTASGLGFVIEF